MLSQRIKVEHVSYVMKQRVFHHTHCNMKQKENYVFKAVCIFSVLYSKKFTVQRRNE